ncbi:MAG: hypothetical protein IPP66_13435 [Anaerolineales bacterium]|nr:hypothetical protein [Anaerolineales bacterium]
MNDNKIGLRIFAGLVLVAAIAGIAFFAFQAGVVNGSRVTIQAPSGDVQAAPVPYPMYGYGYGHGMPFHHFGFGLGCFGILIPLFLFFLAMKAFRMMVWGPRWWGHMGHHHGHGPWGRHWEGGVPPMFAEWHKRAHNPSEESKESAKDSE